MTLGFVDSRPRPRLRSASGSSGSVPVESPNDSIATPTLPSIDSRRLFIGVSTLARTTRPPFELAGAAADQHQRQVAVIVTVAVADAAAVQDHRLIEQRAVADGVLRRRSAR